MGVQSLRSCKRCRRINNLRYWGLHGVKVELVLTTASRKTVTGKINLSVDDYFLTLSDFKKGVWDGLERPPHPYPVSKAAAVALTFMQQREFDRDARADLVVNAVST